MNRGKDRDPLCYRTAKVIVSCDTRSGHAPICSQKLPDCVHRNRSRKLASDSDHRITFIVLEPTPEIVSLNTNFGRFCRMLAAGQLNVSVKGL